MNATEFVKNWKIEKESLLDIYTSRKEETSVSSMIEEMGLTSEQNELLNSVIDNVLTDVFYSLLLGLDGSARIGEIQHSFKLYDEDGNLISECGDIEAEAWEQFHGE